MNLRFPLALVVVALLLVAGHATVVPATSDTPHPAGACSQPYHVQGAGWDFCWQQENARVQGLEINRAYFHGESVAWKMGVPFTLTQYENPAFGPFKDVFGTPGGGVPGYGLGAMVIPAEDCPRFFGDGQRLHNNRVCVEEREGPAPAIAIWSRFNAFNYRFIQGWIFDSQGHITPLIAMGGRLIDGANIGAHGTNHYHHLYWRIDFDVASPDNDVFQQFQRIPGGGDLIGNVLGLLPCQANGIAAVVSWCDIPIESKLYREPNLHTKWRVKDAQDTNALGRHKSYEFSLFEDAPASEFSSFDVMIVQYQGDSQEIGYEVPTNPFEGDAALNTYVMPPEVVTDPVVWAVLHIYHDTRDEERGSMSYHWADFDIRPNNFMDSNPGESTYP